MPARSFLWWRTRPATGQCTKCMCAGNGTHCRGGGDYGSCHCPLLLPRAIVVRRWRPSPRAWTWGYLAGTLLAIVYGIIERVT